MAALKERQDSPALDEYQKSIADDLVALCDTVLDTVRKQES